MIGWIAADQGLLKFFLLIVVGFVLLAAISGLVGAVGEAVDGMVMEVRGRLYDVDTSKSHAAEKHGEELTSTIRNCIENGGYIQTWRKADRYIEVCMLPIPEKPEKFDEEHFGLRVCTDDPDCGFVELTCFDLDCNLPGVEDYLMRSGYSDITIYR